MKKTVLIADDEMLKVITLKARLDQAGYNVLSAADGNAALELLRSEPVDAVVTDVRMPGLDGLSLLEKAKERNPALPVLVMTGYGAVEDAVRAMRIGAEDYLMKPVSADEILVRLERALAKNKDKSAAGPLEDPGFSEETVFVSDAMRSVFDKLKKAARTDSTVLIAGETGAGKEVCARYLHQHSLRAQGPFVSVSCAALAPGVVESELFGHEKGAFTGAVSRRDGRLSVARGGTLFLDDVDDIPLEVQTKLLTVLENSTFERVGGAEPIKADVRFVAATKKDLELLVAAGKFREDLMYRLKVVQVEVPPLRNRPEDIGVLARFFLNRTLARMGRPPKIFDPEAAAALQQYHWPGNVRELEHLAESISAIHDGEIIRRDDLPHKVLGNAEPGLFRFSPEGKPNIDYESAMRGFEKSLLQWALAQSGGSQVKAARLLNIPRSTFNYRWTKLNEKS